MGHFGTFLLWTFIVPLCITDHTDVKAPQVIGSPRPIVAAVGDDVILQCHLEPKSNVQGLTVEWSRPDLKPDPSDRLRLVKYVHIYRRRREDHAMKIQSYKGRTMLFTNELKNGNISLKIMNVTLADKGRYKCFLPKLKSPVRESIVHLVVVPKSVETQTTETSQHHRTLQTPDAKNETDVKGFRLHLYIWIPVVTACVLLLLAGTLSGCLVKHKCQKQKHPL